MPRMPSHDTLLPARRPASRSRGISNRCHRPAKPRHVTKGTMGPVRLACTGRSLVIDVLADTSICVLNPRENGRHCRCEVADTLVLSTASHVKNALSTVVRWIKGL